MNNSAEKFEWVELYQVCRVFRKLSRQNYMLELQTALIFTLGFSDFALKPEKAFFPVYSDPKNQGSGLFIASWIFKNRFEDALDKAESEGYCFFNKETHRQLKKLMSEAIAKSSRRKLSYLKMEGFEITKPQNKESILKSIYEATSSQIQHRYGPLDQPPGP